MGKWVLLLLVAVSLLAAAAVGGGAVGREMGYDAALRAVGEHLIIETDTPPWTNRGDAGFTLCLSLSEEKTVTAATAKCLQEVQPAAEEDSAEVEEQTEAEKILEEISPGNGGR